MSKEVTLWRVYATYTDGVQLFSVKATERKNSYLLHDRVEAFRWARLLHKVNAERFLILESPTEAILKYIERQRVRERELLENAEIVRKSWYDAQALLDQLKES